ncbi:MAG: DHH family phosphoesterase [Eubacteriales bacterium]
MDKARQPKLQKKMQYPSFLAMMLEIRGFHTKDDIDALFDVSKSFADPFLMKDMDCAVARIQRAIENFETICVYGDYDADGVTSTAMLYSYLESCGANVMFYIPLRGTRRVWSKLRSFGPIA